MVGGALVLTESISPFPRFRYPLMERRQGLTKLTVHPAGLPHP